MKKIIITFIILLICIFYSISLTPSGLVQDGVYKYNQLLDYEANQKAGFHRFFADAEIDPNFDYEIYPEYFGHKIGGKFFVTFPWFWVYLNYYLFKLLGFAGLFLIPALSGILSIFALKVLLEKLETNSDLILFTIYFYVLSSSLLIYSTWYYEATLCNLLLFLFLILNLDTSLKSWLLLKNRFHFYRNNILLIFLSLSFLAGLILLRTEVFSLATMLFFMTRFLHGKRTFEQTLKLGLYIIIPVSIYIFFNLKFYGKPMDLRFYQTSQFSLFDRFWRILEYLFFSKHSLILYIPISFFSFYYLIKVKEKRNVNWMFLISVWLFIIIIPFLAPQQQGSDISPRYYFPIIPFLAYFSMKAIEEYFPKRINLLQKYTLIHSGIIILLTVIITAFTSRYSNKLYKTAQPYFGKYNVIYPKLPAHILFKDTKQMFYAPNTSHEIDSLIEKLQSGKRNDSRLFIYKNISMSTPLEQYRKKYKILYEDKDVVVLDLPIK